MKNNLNCFIILLASIFIFISSYSIYQASQGNIDFNSEFEQDRMEQQKEYWQGRALQIYLQEWPKFTVEFDNTTGYLTSESGGDGMVTIIIDNPNVTIKDSGNLFEYLGNKTWRFYARSGVWFQTTLLYPENISFNITVIKDIEGFVNPFSESEGSVWSFPPVEKIIKVRT